MANAPLQFLNAADTAPANSFAAVTPSDSTDLPLLPSRGLYIGTAGNVALVGVQGSSAVTFVGVPAGYILPVKATRVMATNTTATNIVALY